MAVTITAEQVAVAVRVGTTPQELDQITRLRAFGIEVVSKHLGDAYATAPETIVNESLIRIVGYMFDQPNASRGLGWASALRNSGAAAMLLPWRVHGAGSVGEDDDDDDDGNGDETDDTVITTTTNRIIAMQISSITIPSDGSAINISDGLEAGTYLAQIRVASGLPGILYATSATAPTDDDDYFRADGGDSFVYCVDSTADPTWVKVTDDNEARGPYSVPIARGKLKD